jgi:hypothetical protein
VTSPKSVHELRAGFLDPPTSSAPMMRWWWFGPSVDRAEIDRELAVMADAGLGGVEVAYVYPLSPDSERFLSPQFLADLRYAADAAHKLGLRFDLTLGSGWSFGGPHITAELAARTLHWERREISPGPAQVPVAALWPGDELVAAYLGPGSLQEPPEELSPLPVVDGSIEVPDGTGTRQVLLAYARLTGQNVKRAAFGAEGPVLDHYSAAAAEQHVRHVGDRMLDAVPAHLVGSVFCDSLEVYGSDWTPGLLEEFQRRRGYDPLPTLYQLVVEGAGATRLRADYHRTLAELYEDHFVAVIRRWAAARGVPFRIQGYGTPPAMISSYRAADLFEGEGWGWTELTQTRWASSAAHLYGREVVSSEVWTWVHSPSFRATPLDLKGEAHEHLLAGVNQLIGHGWPYSPPHAPGLGWFFYAAGALDDRNPWWPSMPSLARYLSRLCWLMRQGLPVSDVLVYVPAEDVFATMGSAVGGSLDAWRETRRVVGDGVLRVIRQGGWDFDLVDDDALAVLPANDSRPVIISGATTLSEVAQVWFDRFVAAGGTVIMVDSTVDIPGARSCDVPEIVAALAASAGPAVQIEPPTTDVGVVQRHTADADIYLVINTGPTVRQFTLSPRSDRGWYEEWDAQSGRVLRSGQPGGAGVHLTLHPYQGTVLVITSRDAEQSGAGPCGDHGAQRRVVLRDGRQLRFADRDSDIDVVLPHRWEDDPERLACSGSATYSTTVDLPDLRPSDRVVIDFGAAPARGYGHADPGGIRGHSYRAEVDPPVGVMAEVRVNDVDCGMVWAPPYVLDVSRGVVPGPNRVEVIIRNTLANAIAHDQQLEPMVAESERRYGRRFRMQELDLAMEGTQSGLLAVPTLVITTSGSRPLQRKA